MARTVVNASPRSEDVWGRHRIRVAKVTWTSTYVAGGESLVPADVGLSSIEYVAPQADAATAAAGWVPEYNYTTQKLLLKGQVPTDATTTTVNLKEADAAEAVTNAVVRVLVVGN